MKKALNHQWTVQEEVATELDRQNPSTLTRSFCQCHPVEVLVFALAKTVVVVVVEASVQEPTVVKW